MLTLDAIKEKIRQIDEINDTLKKLQACPDPFTKPLCHVTYNDGGLNPDSFLPSDTLKKVISVGIQHLERQLYNELTTLMGEIQCSNMTSVESQSSSNQTST